MSEVSSWSTTADSNNVAAPNGFPEGMAPSGLNNAARELMAAVRRNGVTVDTLAELKVLSQSNSRGYAITRGESSVGDGGASHYIWRSGDQSAHVTADTNGKDWVPPNDDDTGASGAWQRILQTHTYESKIGLSQIGTLDLSDYKYAWFPFHTSASAGGGGRLHKIDSGTANGVTIYEDAAGNLWERDDQTLLTPEMAGAIGDGSTDDTVAIQDVLDYIRTLAGGVLTLVSQYRVTSQLQIMSDNTILRPRRPLKDGFICGDDFVDDYVINFSNVDGVNALAECGAESLLFEFDGTHGQCPKGIRYNYLIRNSFFRDNEFYNWSNTTIESDKTPWADRSEQLEVKFNNIRSPLSTTYVMTAPRMALRFTNETTFLGNRLFGGRFDTIATWPDGRTAPLLELDNCQGIDGVEQNFFAYVKGTAIRVISSNAGSQVQGINLENNSFEKIQHAADGSLRIVEVIGGTGAGERVSGFRFKNNRYNQVPNTSTGDRPSINISYSYYADIDDSFCDIVFGTSANNGHAKIYGLTPQAVTDTTGTNTVIQMKDRGLAVFASSSKSVELLASDSIPRTNHYIDPDGNSTATDTVGLRARNASNIAHAQLHFNGVNTTPFQATPYAFTVGEWGTTGAPAGDTNSNVISNSIMVNSADKTLMVKILGVWYSVALTAM